MLPLLLVIFAAQSAFASPSVLVSQYDIDDIPKPVDTSRSVFSSYHVETGWELLNEADANILILTIEQIQKDLANSPDSRAKALSVCQLIAIIGELAPGRSGDACTYANVINGIVGNADIALSVAQGEWLNRIYRAIDIIRSLASNKQSVRYQVINAILGATESPLSTAQGEWLNRIYRAIDVIRSLAANNHSVRYQTGQTGNCPGAGRSYNFEAYWDKLFRSVNPIEVDLLNELYCAAKRLYRAWNIRSNVIGAAVTACANPRAVRIFQESLPATSYLFRAVGNNGDVEGAAAGAIAAIRRAAA